MKLGFAVIALSFATLAATAGAQTNSFQLIDKNGKTIGKTNFTIDKTKDGFRVKSKFEYHLVASGPSTNINTRTDAAYDSPGSSVVDAQFSSDYKVDENGNYLSGFTQNSADQMITSFYPTKTRDAVVISQTQGGVGLGSKSLGMPKPDFIVAPDYDPSAIQMLLTTVLTHAHTDHLYLLAVPPSSPRAANNALYLTVADPTDATGTLDGKPIALKHYALGWNKAKGDLYADTNGTLMQADIGTINARYVRAKFVLDDKPAQ